MPLYLIRHAKAGKRSSWIGDDTERPLDAAGLLQAEALARQLAPISPSALLSSPYERCRQTLGPLAAVTGLPVADEHRIAEDSPLERSLAALEDAPENAVLCSHGDVIPDVINGLLRRGMEMADRVQGVKKGAMFVLHREGGSFVRAEYRDAPRIDDAT